MKAIACILKHPNARIVVAALMESGYYLSMPLKERKLLVKRILLLTLDKRC